MATAPREQRVYRAACPGCGAPVEFRSAQSTHAICPYCRSMVVRSGDVLSRIGTIAEVLDDHTPLQLMAAGKHGGRPFTLIGRLQYKSTTGLWTEWIAFFDDGTTAILGEDNGAYVMSTPWTLPGDMPDARQAPVGSSLLVGNGLFNVASNDRVALVSAQGELPKLPPLGVAFANVELRNARGEVVSLDYSGGDRPAATIGVAVQLPELQLTGLRDASVSQDKGARAFSCPNCGAPVELRLGTTKSITCGNCHSIIDVAGGIGGELRHAEQSQTVTPLIALGTLGRLQGEDWQVVGFQQRTGRATGDPDPFSWSEYLLFNSKRGFMFLVDAEDGWSIVRPVTGAPRAIGQSASYLGLTYKLDFAYEAVTNYVAGEFYWPVERGQRTSNRDYSLGGRILSSERTASEETWSSGDKVDSSVVVSAFGLGDRASLRKRSDVTPLAGKTRLGCGTIILVIIVLIIILVVLSTCTSSGGSGSGAGVRSSGGSFGGYSSGGGHK